MGIAACLHQSKSTPTQLDIQLRGTCNDYDDYVDPPSISLIERAVKAIRFLGPFCGPLTHITVSGQAPRCEHEDFAYFLNSVAGVCATSLTHLSVTIDAAATNPELGNNEEEEEPAHHYFMDSNSVDALTPFTSLTHVNLPFSSICEKSVWAALPSSVQSLCLNSSRRAPHHSLILPNLRELTLQHSHCHPLKRLLEACPRLQKLNVVALTAPRDIDEQRDLEVIMAHPVWRRNYNGHPGCTPVTALYLPMELVNTRAFESDSESDDGEEEEAGGEEEAAQGEEEEAHGEEEETDGGEGEAEGSEETGTEEAEPEEEEEANQPGSNTLRTWVALAGLPAMHTIVTFQCDFTRYLGGGGGGFMSEVCAERILHQISRAFPNLRSLSLKGLFLLDSDLTELYLCQSLTKIELHSSDHITGRAVLSLAAALPRLVRLYVNACELITNQHQDAIKRVFKDRAVIIIE